MTRQTSIAAADFAALAHGLESEGWGLQDAFVDPVLARALHDDALHLHDQGEFKPAAVGTGKQRVVRPDVRGDEIYWIANATRAPIREVCARFEELRLALNRKLALGLFEHELHYARYAPGAFYERHLDRLAGDTNRVLSMSLYLNENWSPGDGGQLRVHLQPEVLPPATPRFIDIEPRAGRLVIFLSGEIAHQVLPATRPRFSLTGWFRRCDSTIS